MHVNRPCKLSNRLLSTLRAGRLLSVPFLYYLTDAVKKWETFVLKLVDILHSQLLGGYVNPIRHLISGLFEMVFYIIQETDTNLNFFTWSFGHVAGGHVTFLWLSKGWPVRVVQAPFDENRNCLFEKQRFTAIPYTSPLLYNISPTKRFMLQIMHLKLQLIKDPTLSFNTSVKSHCHSSEMFIQQDVGWKYLIV